MTMDCGLSVNCWQGIAGSAGGVGEDHCHGKILLTYSPAKGKLDPAWCHPCSSQQPMARTED